jgi:Mrp family chromosome partitioning ATPase
LGLWGAFFIKFFRGLDEGLPLSLEGLRAHGLLTAGALSRYADCRPEEMVYADLQTLRETAHFITQRKKPALGAVVSLIGGKYLNYSHCLAHLLSLQNARVLLVQADFEGVVHPDDKPGLWQYLNKEILQLPIRRIRGYDFIPTGGTDRYSAEKLASVEFSHFLQDLRARYDYVVLFSSFPPSSAEAKIVFNWSDALVVSVKEENFRQLKPWSVKQKNTGLIFISLEEAAK